MLQLHVSLLAYFTRVTSWSAHSPGLCGGRGRSKVGPWNSVGARLAGLADAFGSKGPHALASRLRHARGRWGHVVGGARVGPAPRSPRTAGAPGAQGAA